MKKEFKYSVREIKEKKGLSDKFDCDVSVFSEVFSEMTLLNSLNLNITFSLNKTSILLEADMKADVTHICSRCGKEFRSEINDSFDEIYSLDNEEIDITDLIKETLTLGEPIKPLCSKNCKIEYKSEFISFNRISSNRLNISLNKNTEGSKYAKSKEKTHKIKKR